jgi:hypothetical protein
MHHFPPVTEICPDLSQGLFGVNLGIVRVLV